MDGAEPSILAVDAGNTRIKWGLHDLAVWRARGISPTTDAAHIGLQWNAAPRGTRVIASNVAGPEVESCLLTHPAVAECGVVGAADEERGQIVKAFVVLRPNTAPSTALVATLQDFVKQTVAPYKYPRAIEFRTELPRTEAGKLQRFRLRQPEKPA